MLVSLAGKNRDRTRDRESRPMTGRRWSIARRGKNLSVDQ